MISRGHRDSELRTYSLDKLELLHKYGRQQDGDDRVQLLDVSRMAVVSTLSEKGHKAYEGYRKALLKEATGAKPAAASQKKVQKAVASKLVAMGAQMKK